jgi:mannonate dehydratase
MSTPPLPRRRFLAAAATGAALAGPASRAATPGAPAVPPMLMKAGHQHDHSTPTLQALAAFGVSHICSGKLSREIDKDWTVDALTRLRRHVESFGIRLECVPLPMSSGDILHAEHPEILLGREPERERAIEGIRIMIRHCGKAGIPMVKYNLTFIGVVRSPQTIGRGGAKLSTFRHAELKPQPEFPGVGRVTEEIYWDRIGYFLKKVVPVAEEAGVRLACHPQDPGFPRGTGWRGVETVLGSPEGLRRFVETCASPNHGLNFCQGTISEMLRKPNEEIHDIIRDFGRRRKIFMVHFRNIRGGWLDFQETFPDDGDVDMMRALRAYREIGFDGMVMPDHVPEVAGDPTRQKSFAFCFGYIQALLEQLRRESQAASRA